MTRLRTTFDDVTRASRNRLKAAHARDLARDAAGEPAGEWLRLYARRLEGAARVAVGRVLRTRPRG